MQEKEQEAEKEWEQDAGTSEEDRKEKITEGVKGTEEQNEIGRNEARATEPAPKTDLRRHHLFPLLPSSKLLPRVTATMW